MILPTKKYIIKTLLLTLSSTVILAMVLSFCYHIAIAQTPLDIVQAVFVRVPLIVMNILFVVFFIKNKPEKSLAAPEKVSFLWAVLGTYLPFFFVFDNRELPLILNIIVFVCSCFAIYSVFTLGKSADILVSDREIVVSGSYRYLRHPLYSSYLLINFIYLVTSHFLLWRTLLFVFWAFTLLMRIYYEEKYLSKNDKYKKYALMVKYRIIPLIW